MSNFVASNGISVEINDDEQIIFEVPNRPTSPIWVSNGEIDALREYIIAQEDKRLGRWRWPENPNYVVYPVGEGLVDVLRESGVSDQTRGPGREQGISREKAVEWDRDYTQNFYKAARAFFDAHPEPKPAWCEAQPGEFWEITLHNEPRLAKTLVPVYTPDVPIAFLPVDREGATWVAATSPHITAGHLVWSRGDES